jgi:hypothetical protein
MAALDSVPFSMMSLERSHKRSWSWLLAVLIFGTAWGGLFVRVRPAAGGCATTSHACCCAHAHKADCACDGHAGAASQFASLATCAGANDLPAFLMAPPPALLARADVGLLAPQPVGVGPAAASRLWPSAAQSPPFPPPQA